MNFSQPRKLLLFGAGRIGRSFIAPLFCQSGYTITFVDSDSVLVDLLNAERSYRIVIKEDTSERIMMIDGFKALHTSNRTSITEAIVSCDICAVSVGQRNLSIVAGLMTDGLIERYSLFPEAPIDIILAENMRDISGRMRELLEKGLSDSFPLEDFVGLVETSIGKMVPYMTEKDKEEDALQLFAEPYNTLILDEKAFRNPVPQVKGLAPTANMKAWVNRKLFLHNLGHACLAYLANKKNPDWIYTWEALVDTEVRKDVIRCMEEAAIVLLCMHPGIFTSQDLSHHIADLTQRFANKSLGDTIYRVGCDLERKLGPADRLVPVIRFANRNSLYFENVLRALVYGVFFDARGENGQHFPADIEFLRKYNRNVNRVLIEHCRLNTSEDQKILDMAAEIANRIDL